MKKIFIAVLFVILFVSPLFIDRNLPEGMSLFVSAQSPNNDTFSPEILLSGEGKSVIEVSPGAAKDNRIKYRLVCDGIDEYKGEVGVVFTVIDN